MSTKEHRVLGSPPDPEDTVEMPAMIAGEAPGTTAVLAVPVAAPVPAPAAAPGPGPAAQELARAHEAELAALRGELAALTESRAQLERSLGSLTTSLRQLENQLRERTAQVLQLERESLAREHRLVELEKDLVLRREQHALASAECAELRARLERAQQELGAIAGEQQATALANAGRERDERDAALAQARIDIAELQRRDAAQSEALQHMEGRRHLFDSMLREREHLLDERDARAQGLERELQAAREAVAGAIAEQERLNAGLAAERAEREAALRTALEGAFGDARAAEVVRLAAEEHAALEIEALRTQLATVSGELAARDAHIATLQSPPGADAAATAAMHSEPQPQPQPESEPEPVAVVAAQAADDAPPPGASMATSAAAGASGSQATLDGHTGLLVRTDGDSGIVHVVRRKTTIGRTPDNDICIEADFISRHHAVVLVSAQGTYIEDLNSTNGVYVNGSRVSRRQLANGDVVTVGKTGFRFLRKASPEPSTANDA